MMAKHNGQFGQRVRLDPRSASGSAYMHDSSGGWMVAPFDGNGWGAPSSSHGGSCTRENSMDAD
eukprot:3272832-Karenia_brevis.AAC.1